MIGIATLQSTQKTLLLLRLRPARRPFVLLDLNAGRPASGLSPHAQRPHGDSLLLAQRAGGGGHIARRQPSPKGGKPGGEQFRDPGGPGLVAARQFLRALPAVLGGVLRGEWAFSALPVPAGSASYQSRSRSRSSPFQYRSARFSAS
jgi:hypothetical protein